MNVDISKLSEIRTGVYNFMHQPAENRLWIQLMHFRAPKNVTHYSEASFKAVGNVFVPTSSDFFTTESEDNRQAMHLFGYKDLGQVTTTTDFWTESQLLLIPIRMMEHINDFYSKAQSSNARTPTYMMADFLATDKKSAAGKFSSIFINLMYYEFGSTSDQLNKLRLARQIAEEENVEGTPLYQLPANSNLDFPVPEVSYTDFLIPSLGFCA